MASLGGLQHGPNSSMRMRSSTRTHGWKITCRRRYKAEGGYTMKRVLILVLLLAVVADTGSGPAFAAGTQPFFQGYWRCQNGAALNISSAFGPWLSYRSTRGSEVAQSYVYHDTAGGGWVNTGVDSTGGYWTMTSSGWQNEQLTFTGTYTNNGRTGSQRQIITRNASGAMTIQLRRNGSMIDQTGCNRPRS